MKSDDQYGGQGNGRPGRLSVLPSRLTARESAELAELEKVIKQGWRPFLAVGRALLKIREKQLHKEYGSFEAYCQTRWGFGRAHACRLMNASVVATLLSDHGRTRTPRCESHVRALINLKPAVAAAAWKRTRELAGARAVTTELVRTAIAEVTAKRRPATRAPKTEKSPNRRDRVLRLIDRAVVAAKHGDFRTVTGLLVQLRRLLAAATQER